jgi:hypothetical protein
MRRLVLLVVLAAVTALAFSASSALARGGPGGSGGFLGCSGGPWFGVKYTGSFLSVDQNRNHWYCYNSKSGATKDDG